MDWGKTTAPLPEVAGEALKQFSNSRRGIWLVQSNFIAYACPQGWKMAAAPPGSVSAFQGGERKGKGKRHMPAKSHGSLSFVCQAKFIP